MGQGTWGMDPGDDGAAEHLEELEQQQAFEANQEWLESMVARYKDAVRAETGATIRCPFCEKLFVKKTYHKKFCSNQKLMVKRIAKIGIITTLTKKEELGHNYGKTKVDVEVLK